MIKPRIANTQGQSIDLFLNSTYPALYDLERDAKVCIVGNSGKLLQSECGADIDDYDVVIRCNHAPTKGYENYVGSKTTLRIVNGECFAGIVSPEIHTAATPDFLPTQPSQDLLFWKVWIIDELVKGVYANANIHNLYFLNSQIIHNIAQQFKLQGEPSTGLVMIYILLAHFDKVDLYGFTFGEANHKYHYFEEVNKPSIPHSFDIEHQVVKYLEADNRLKIH